MQQRVIRFLLDQSRKEPEKYGKFFEDYGLFIREGIITVQEQDVKVPTLVFQSATSSGGQRVSLRAFYFKL